jgi:hypothetical protein
MPNRPTADRCGGPPQRSPDFAHLSLDGLRHYRATLTAEEGRVSYWRRIIQARLDLVRAAQDGTTAGVEDLRAVFSDTRVNGTRTALVTVDPVDDMPPLPDLASVWARQPVDGDIEGNSALVQDLMKAEAQLSAYRSALHRRLARSTGELIARYHEHPDLCLSALPTRRASNQQIAL